MEHVWGGKENRMRFIKFQRIRVDWSFPQRKNKKRDGRMVYLGKLRQRDWKAKRCSL